MTLRPRFDVDGLEDDLYVCFDPNDPDSALDFVASLNAVISGLVAEAVCQFREEKEKAAPDSPKSRREFT